MDNIVKARKASTERRRFDASFNVVVSVIKSKSIRVTLKMRKRYDIRVIVLKNLFKL